MKDIYDIIRTVRRRPNQQFVLATLVRAEGSSYRRPGARMLICRDGVRVGSLSGGCLEEEIVQRSRDVLCHGIPALIPFDTRPRFGCSGRIDVFLQRVTSNFFSDLATDLAARRRFVALTKYPGGELIQPVDPPIRLIVVGEGPDSGPLRNLAALLGWETIEAAEATTLEVVSDEWTAAIIKTHNYGRDFVALQRLLPLQLRYVGLIGPRRRRDQLMNDLLDTGVTINAGFFSPAGIDFGGETPEEIALEVISEIQRVLVGGSGTSLRERKMPIHCARAHTTPITNCANSAT